ncbi:MAG: sodium-dependent transporter [Pseudomonadota bacterium]|nr:sodium-dependent transporter [Pseudomonadota bacterium]
MQITETPIRGQWSSRLGFVLATTGAAVGVGNIWKFPYMVGENGGSAFVIVYILAVFLVGIPIMLAEIMIGRRGRHNPVDTLKILAGEANASPKWQSLGWLCVVILLLVLSFYSVVAGWSIAYCWDSLTGQLNNLNATQVEQHWQNFLASPLKLTLWHTVFIIITLWVVERGVHRGLEQASRIMMPCLFLILIILDIYGFFNEGFKEACQFLFTPDFSKITPSVAISALGHAFFTLAVGAGCMLVYGSYLPRKTAFYMPVMTIVLLDVLVAILAGLAIFPIVFTHHLTVTSGPGLIFEALPIAFAKIAGGQIIGTLFYLLFLFAAWTSSLSMAEPVVVLIAERYNGSRVKASFIVGGIAWVLGIGSVLSFNYWADYRIFGRWNFFGAITDLATNILQPIGGIGFAIFAGWIMHKLVTKEELMLPKSAYAIWRFLIRYMAPLGIMAIFVASVWS